MVFRIIVGVLTILFAALIFLLLGTLKDEESEALSETGYTGLYVTSGILLLISSILGIFLRKMKICRIASAGLLLVGSFFPFLIWMLAHNAASMVNMSISKVFGDNIGSLIEGPGMLSILFGLFSIVLLVLSFKKPKTA
ncbi:MAG: hypothetical protein FWH41_07145 [Treponema sp.]|nr:hypothetical protein [Treponema sp.]